MTEQLRDALSKTERIIYLFLQLEKNMNQYESFTKMKMQSSAVILLLGILLYSISNAASNAREGSYP